MPAIDSTLADPDDQALLTAMDLDDSFVPVRTLAQGDGGTSIGLNNVNRRLVLNYGEQSALKLLSHEGMGTCVMFRIPLEGPVSPQEA